MATTASSPSFWKEQYEQEAKAKAATARLAEKLQRQVEELQRKLEDEEQRATETDANRRKAERVVRRQQRLLETHALEIASLRKELTRLEDLIQRRAVTPPTQHRTLQHDHVANSDGDILQPSPKVTTDDRVRAEMEAVRQQLEQEMVKLRDTLKEEERERRRAEQALRRQEEAFKKYKENQRRQKDDTKEKQLLKELVNLQEVLWQEKSENKKKDQLLTRLDAELQKHRTREEAAEREKETLEHANRKLERELASVKRLLAEQKTHTGSAVVYGDGAPVHATTESSAAVAELKSRQLARVVRRLEKTVSELQNKLDAAEKAKRELEAANQRLTGEVRELNAAVTKEFEARLALVKQKVALEESTEHKQNVDDEEAASARGFELTQLRLEQTRLEAAVRDLENKLSKEKRRADEAVAEVRRTLERRIKELERTVEDKEAERTELEKSKKQLEGKLAEVERRLEDRTKEKDAVSGELSVLRKALEGLHAKLEAAVAEGRQLEEEKAALSQQVAVLDEERRRRQRLEEDKLALEKDLRRLRSELDDARTAARSEAESLELARRDILRLTERTAMLQGELDGMLRDKAEKELLLAKHAEDYSHTAMVVEDKTRLERKLREVEGELSLAKKQAERSAEEQRKHEADSKEAKKKLEDERRLRAAVEDEKRKLEEDLRNARKEVDKYRSKWEQDTQALRGQSDGLRAELERVKRDHASAADGLARAQEELQQRAVAADKYKREAERERAELEARLRELREELDRARKKAIKDLGDLDADRSRALAALKAQLADEAASRKKLEAALASSSSSNLAAIAASADEAEKWRRKADEAAAEAAQFRAKYDSEVAAKLKLVEDHEASLTAERKARKKADKTAKSLEAELSALKQQLSASAAASQQAAVDQSQVDELRALLAAEQARARELETVLTKAKEDKKASVRLERTASAANIAKDVELTAMRERVAAAQQEVAVLRGQVEEARRQREQLEKRQKKKDEEAWKATQEAAAVRQQLAEEEAKLRMVRDEMDRRLAAEEAKRVELEKALRATRLERDETGIQTTKHQREKEEVEGRVARLRKEKEEAENKLADLRRERDEAEAKALKLVRDKEAAEAKADRLGREKDEAEQRAERFRKAKDEVEAKLAAVRNDKDDAEAKAELARKAKDEAERRAQRLIEEREEAEARAAKLKLQLAEAQGEVKALKARELLLLEQEQKRAAATSSAAAASSALQAELDTLKRKLNEAQDRLLEEQRARKEAEEAARRAQKELAGLETAADAAGRMPATARLADPRASRPLAPRNRGSARMSVRRDEPAVPAVEPAPEPSPQDKLSRLMAAGAVPMGGMGMMMGGIGAEALKKRQSMAEKKAEAAPAVATPKKPGDAGEKRTLMVLKGKKRVQAWRVELRASSLNSGDVFILDLDSTIYQWNGAKANKLKRAKGVDITQRLNRQRGARAKILNIDEGHEDSEFWSAFGGKTAVQEAKDDDAEAEKEWEEQTKLWRVDEAAGDLVRVDDRLVRETLQDDQVYVLDCLTEVYVWMGKAASPALRKLGQSLAAQLYDSVDRPAWSAGVVRATQDGEPVLFVEKFSAWPDSFANVMGKQQHPTKKIAAASPEGKKKAKADVTKLFDARPREEPRPVDDGSGQVKVWRVVDAQKEDVAPDSYGHFYSAHCYVILYTYGSESSPSFLVYFWQGRDGNRNEKGSSATLAMELAKSVGRGASQVRVLQHKEPRHFLLLFKGSIVIHRGREDAADPAAPALYQARAVLRGTDFVTTTQVPLAARSLDSTDAFYLRTLHTAFVWSGIHASPAERDAVLALAKRYSQPIQQIAEKAEPQEFWTALGGAKDYADERDTKPDYTARLFAFSSTSGAFEGEELYGYTQDDLDPKLIYLLDTWVQVFLWIGPQAKEEDKKLAMETALDYVAQAKDGRPKERPPVCVEPGHEPLQFRRHFFGWQAGEENDPLQGESVFTLLAAYNRTFTIDELRAKETLPKTVDTSRLEQYLSDEEFLKVFEMDKAEFAKLPEWKKSAKKKQAGLY